MSASKWKQPQERLWPLARTEGLLSRALPGGDALVYDQERHLAHTLNGTAQLVWRQCDGQTNQEEIARRLSEVLGLPANGVVELALEALGRAHLLNNSRSAERAEISRRAVMRKLGRAAGLAALLPTVVSVAVPPPAAAASELLGPQSCTSRGHTCRPLADCPLDQDTGGACPGSQVCCNH
jgi:hypothetical protein